MIIEMNYMVPMKRVMMIQVIELVVVVVQARREKGKMK